MISKKGIFDIFFLLIIVFFVAVIGLLTYKLSHSITQAYVNSGVLASSPVALHANSVIDSQGRIVADEFVFFMFLGMMIATIISAARTNFSPTVIFFFILELLMAIVLAAGLVNIYSGIAQTPVLMIEAQQLTLTNIIISRYTPLMICALGGLILLIMYGKSGGEITV